MTEWYCHFDPNEFAQARRVQENLLLPENARPVEAAAGAEETANRNTKAGGAKAADKAGRVLPFPAQENAKKRKRA